MLLFYQIIVNERICRRCLVNPTLVQIFCKLAVGNHEFQFHKGGYVVVDAHNHGVSAVGIFGIVAKIGLAFLETHTVVASVLHDFVANGRGNFGEEQRKATHPVLRDAQHIAFRHAVDEVGVQKFGQILLALHIRQPVVVGRAYVEDCRFGKGNRHFVEHEKNDKFLNLAVEGLIRAETFLQIFHRVPQKNKNPLLPCKEQQCGSDTIYYIVFLRKTSAKAKNLSKYNLL